jgi:hypothetical protein
MIVNIDLFIYIYIYMKKFSSKFLTFAFVIFLTLVILSCCFRNNSNIMEGLTCIQRTSDKSCYDPSAGGLCTWDQYKKKCGTKACGAYRPSMGDPANGYCPSSRCRLKTISGNLKCA